MSLFSFSPANGGFSNIALSLFWLNTEQMSATSAVERQDASKIRICCHYLLASLSSETIVSTQTLHIS